MKTDRVEIYYYRTFEYNLARFLTVMEGELRAMGATMVQVSPFKTSCTLLSRATYVTWT